ncbi:lantibiotic dehydratase [Streptomyces sp. NPDC004838]
MTTAYLRSSVVGIGEAVEAGRTDRLPPDMAAMAAMVAGADPASPDHGSDDDGAAPAGLLDAFLHRRAIRAPRYAALFATTRATLGPRRDLRLPDRSELTFSGRFADGVLQALTDAALARARPDALRLRRNPTVRRTGSRYEFRTWRGNTLALSTVNATAAIEAVLEACGAHGTERVKAAAALEALSPSTPPERLDAFLGQLIDAGLLLMDVPLPDHDGLDRACAACEAAGEEAAARALRRLATAAGEERPFGRLPAEELTGLWREHGAPLDRLLETDPGSQDRLRPRIAPGPGTLMVERSTQAALRRALARVTRLSGESPRQEALTAAFTARHGDAAVPLTELPDLEDEVRGSAWRSDRSTGPGDRTAARALAHWARSGEPYDLADEDDEGLGPSEADGPAHWIRAALLDRFEDRYDAVLLAGYQYLPAALEGDFEVARAHAVDPPAIDDLLVSYDREAGLLLWDERTGAAVPPPAEEAAAGGRDGRMLTALVRPFLDREPVDWTWGELGGELPHLPRVVAGRVIVAPERWRLDAAGVQQVVAAPDAAAALRSALPGLRGRRWLAVTGRGRTLPLDVWSAGAVELALRLLGDGHGIRCEELPQFEAPAVNGRVVELLLPPTTRTEAAVVVPRRRPDDPRPGLRYDIRCRATAADEVPVLAGARMEELASAGDVAHWSYTWDGPDLRIECRVATVDARPGVVAALDGLGSDLVASGRAVGTTLLRGTPRAWWQGASPVPGPAEEIERADSRETATFLATRPGDEERIRWYSATLLGWLPFLAEGTAEQIAILSATAADVNDGAEALHVLTEPPPASGPPRTSGPLVSSLTRFAREWNAAGDSGLARRAHAALLSAHCARVFPTAPAAHRRAGCEAAIHALRDRPAAAETGTGPGDDDKDGERDGV